MKLFTSAQMRQADERSVEVGIPLQTLMERAGQVVSEVALQQFPKAERFLVLCGKGNNGGDGYVAARYLVRAGKHVDVLELSEERKSEASVARDRWLPQGKIPILSLTTLEPTLQECDVVIDALFGTGSSRALEGELAEVVHAVNHSRKPVLSIDIPSGVSGDSGQLLGTAIEACHTVQLVGAKLSSVFYPAKKNFGAWHVADLGVPRGVLESLLTPQLLNDAMIEPWLPTREATAHKYTVGTVLVIGGSARYLGAAELACRGAYRAGAGLVTLAAEARLPPSWPEIIFEPLDWQGQPLETLRAISAKRASVRVIGPGLGDEAQAYLPELIAASAVPTVLDAGALSGDNVWAEAVRKHGRCVLTPHEGEAARLLNVSPRAITRWPLESARTLAETFNAVVVLKGATSVIAAPDGRCFVNTRGHPGMATGGSGDVLAGCLGAWCANASALLGRVAATVYVHAVAGEIAARAYGNGLIASDLIEGFPRAWRERVKE
ncbi:MAG: NAD(P)H-hydrate dehydratase [Trueperaceae bacterium]